MSKLCNLTAYLFVALLALYEAVAEQMFFYKISFSWVPILSKQPIFEFRCTLRYNARNTIQRTYPSLQNNAASLNTFQPLTLCLQAIHPLRIFPGLSGCMQSPCEQPAFRKEIRSSCWWTHSLGDTKITSLSAGRRRWVILAEHVERSPSSESSVGRTGCDFSLERWWLTIAPRTISVPRSIEGFVSASHL